MAHREKQPPVVVGDQGNTLVMMESVGREGDRLHVRAALMGSWMTDMYMDADSLAAMIPMILNRQVLGYVFALPMIRRRSKRAQAAESRY